MTPLREQLLAARTEYRSAQFPGDLAEILPTPSHRRSSRFSRQLRFASGLAAALLLIALGREVQINRDSLSPPSLAAIRLDLNQWKSNAVALAPAGELPKKANVMQAMNTLTPPQTSELLSAVEKPLYDSGAFIVNIGRDLAHHADAFLHLM